TGSCDLHMLFMDEIPGVDAEHHKAAGKESSHPYMQQPVDAGGVEYHGPKIRDLCAGVHSLADNMKTGRRLLPRVGNHDPHCREAGPQKDHDSGEKVYAAADPVPAEDEDAQKTRLKGKGEDAFRREGAPEDIAYIFPIGCPVSPELEFHDDTRRNADPEDQGEDADPKPHGHLIDAVPRSQEQTLHDHEHEPQTNAERRIDVMKTNGEGKLNPGQNFDIHVS